MLKENTKKKLTYILPFICMLWIVIGCGGLSEITETNDPNNPSKRNNGTVKGKNYLVLKRARIIDENGFDRPVEAGSVLVPDGWRVEGGIRWKGLNECRADIITQELKITSPDGSIQFTIFPSKSFVFSDDEMMQRSLIEASKHGGCSVGNPFNASQYLEKSAASLGAKVNGIRKDEITEDKLDKFNEESNALNRQNGLNSNTTASAIYGNLAWNDGTKGLTQIGVSTIITDKPDIMSGGTTRFSTSSVFHHIQIRYKADREAEALKVFGTITTSFRTNPIWLQAKGDFLKRLGDIEHAGRMERIRLMGKQSEAYAKSASEAADSQMRSWERQQASSDASHRRFIQTIREVETWKDSSGSPVELNAGYKYGWSKPDGSYILTDDSLFNPRIELKENWEQMQKVQE